MAELDEPGNEPNLDLFGSFGLDFLSDDERLNKQKKEQTELGQLNDEDIDRNRIEANCKITFFFCSGIINLLFDCLAYNTTGHYAHCSHFSSPLRG